MSVGCRIRTAFLVLDVEVRAGQTPHTLLVLGNSMGRIQTAPFWPSQSHLIAGLGRGETVEVCGEVGSYNGRRQLLVESIRSLPRDQVAWRELLPSIGEVSVWWSMLDTWRAEIKRPRLANTLSLFYDDPDFRGKYEECPASLSGHHAALGGLLQHTCEVAAIARQIGAIAGAEPDLVLTGVLLHDIGKLESYAWNGCFQVTTAGSLLGHVVLGALLLERRLNRAEPCPCTAGERAILHHLILAHHGKLEFGAPVLPMTLEAEVIHYADNASAKTRSMAEALADIDNFPGTAEVSPRGVWELERRRVYRGRSDWGCESSGSAG